MLSKLTKWSGYASILGGLLFVVAVVLHPLRDGISVYNSGAAYGAIHNLGAFGLIFQLFALVGLYVREADVMGRRGLISFVLVFFGQVLYICLLVVDGFLNPVLAQYAPELVHSGTDIDPNLMTIVLPALTLFFLGYIAFGTSLLATKAQPRLGSLLITIGAPIYIIGGISIFILGPASLVVSLIEIAGATPLGLGYCLLGLKLRQSVNVSDGPN
jgi:hypothetical protein